MKKLKAIAVVLTFFSLTSCETQLLEPFKKEASLAEKISSAEVSGYEAKMNQSYGSNQFQKYDVYSPITNEQTPSVSLVVIHGGGWTILDKSFMNQTVEEFKRRKLNVTIFNINHRLAGVDNVRFEDIMTDISLFFKHQDSLKTSMNLSDKRMMWGYSSGGHLALSYAYKYPSQNINVVAALAAPTDLTDESIHTGLIDPNFGNLTERLMGVPYHAKPGAYQEASPVYIANRRSTNTILFYGGNDNLVKKEQGEKLNKLLQNKNVRSEFHLIPNATHDIGNLEVTVNEFLEFIKSVK